MCWGFSGLVLWLGIGLVGTYGLLDSGYVRSRTHYLTFGLAIAAAASMILVFVAGWIL